MAYLRCQHTIIVIRVWFRFSIIDIKSISGRHKAVVSLIRIIAHHKAECRTPMIVPQMETLLILAKQSFYRTTAFQCHRASLVVCKRACQQVIDLHIPVPSQ